MPNRILREGILTSPKVARLGWAEEVMYRRLMSLVDDYGRYFADSSLLRGHLYPRQLNKVSDSDVGKWLSALEVAGLVRVYPAQDGERYLELLNFGQQIRAQKSKFPSPPEDASKCEQPISDAPVFVSESVSESVVVNPAPTALVDPPAANRPPACPTEEIVGLYHEHLPMLPRVEVLNDARRRTISARWREVVTDQDIRKAPDVRRAAIEWFAWYFGHCARSRFLTGKAKDWRADLDFLMTPSKFAKAVEGSYHKEAA